MSDLPKKIKPLRLVADKAHLEGELLLNQFKRLGDSVISCDGVLQASLNFEQDQAGVPLVRGQLKASLQQVCQRCLQPVVLNLEWSMVLAIVTDDKQAAALTADYEPWLITPGVLVSLIDMIEDELILALPIVPMHEEGKCKDLPNEIIN
jgi:uncharacterized protein